MGIEEYLMKEAEDNINDGTYIINLDSNTVNNFLLLLFIDCVKSLQFSDLIIKW